MFGFFKNKKDEDIEGICPVKEEKRLWLDEAFGWLIKAFDSDKIKNRSVFTPVTRYFPVKFNGEPEAALETMKIIAIQMEINADEIHLDIYKQGVRELDTGGRTGGRIFMQNVEGEKYAGGLYWGKQEDGKFHIGLEERKLKSSHDMIATLNHELAHVKLLGEGRIKENNEPLTDLTTIVFGLGIFNANASFKTIRGYDSHGWSKLGYLSQMDWGYALALYAHIRGEENPDWINYLAVNVKHDFKQSAKFIKNNPDKIMKKQEEKNENK